MYLLAEKAREGKTVVRLKWGDPFMFDDGAKEALFLREQGVPFEVVPGIPAGIGAPCYAGVPVTYPGAGDTVTFVRGHESEGSELPRIDWSALARLDGTIVCYAGARQLPGILTALMAHGRDAAEPAVLIYNGTLPGQQTILGTLGELSTAAVRAQDRRPAILVVGTVTALREHLTWFDARPLFGRRIVVTRSREQSEELVDLLEGLGAEAIEVPTIRIVGAQGDSGLDEACRRIGEFDWVVLTSANGADFFLETLLRGTGDIRELKGVRLCAIGTATAARLSRYGLRVDLVPDESRAEGVADALRATGDLTGVKVLLPHAELARDVLADQLRKCGAEVTDVVAYRTVVDGGDVDIYGMLLDKQIDAVTFTSASTVRNFVTILGAESAADLLHATVVAAIGPVTAEAAQQLGITPAIIPSTYTIAALVEALVDHFAAVTK